MYQIIISNSAEKDFEKLPGLTLKKIEIAIDALAGQKLFVAPLAHEFNSI
jgi:mRNA-degrading endonuclease RelE of RelBE toxin-antitoxin system